MRVPAPVLLFATGALLWFSVEQLNHEISGLRMSLFVCGLLVTFGALRTNGRAAGFATFFCGLMIDATSPVPFGLHAMLMLGAHLVIRHVRSRLACDEPLICTSVALVANLAIFLALGFFLVPGTTIGGAMWGRLIADFIISQIFITLIAGWFFALNERLFTMADLELNRSVAQSRF